MKLREKIVLTVVITTLILISIAVFWSRRIVIGSFLELENQDAVKNVQRIVDSLNDEIYDLSLKNKDYAYWDETYKFAFDKNEEYVNSELVDETFSNLKINFWAILDTDFNTMFKKSFDLSYNMEVPVNYNEEMLLRSMSQGPLASEIEGSDGTKGIVMVNKKPMLISSKRILPSNGIGVSRGYMIMGRYLDKDEISYIGRITHLDFSVYDTQSIENSSEVDVKDYYRMNPGADKIDVKPLNSMLIAGYTVLKDIYGKPSLIIRLSDDRQIFHHGVSSVRYMILVIVIIGLIFGALTLFGMENMMLRRILRLNSRVDEIGRSQDFSLRVEESKRDKDELSNLSKSINEMVETIEISFHDIKEKNEKLQELDKLKNEFISTVSHEIRTPLTSIMGFTKIIKKKFSSMVIPNLNMEDAKLAKACEQSLANMDIIISEGERLMDIVNHVLDISKIESGEEDWGIEAVSINEIIGKSLSAVEGLFNGKNLQMICDTDESLPLVNGNKDKLQQVIINLISNAVKFTENGSITCRARVIGREVVVSVIDTGIGISEENYKTIFDKFKQVSDGLVNKPKGTGLGLAICKKIIENYHGRIWVESSINNGSTFSFALPIAD